MNRVFLSFACIGLAVLPTLAAAQMAKNSVIAVVNEFFRAMTTRDTAAFSRAPSPLGSLR